MPDASPEHVSPSEAEQAIAQVREAYQRLRHEIAKVIVGQDEVIDELLMCVLSRGHALIEGVPGLAKTLLISTLARALSLEFNRIQFTPDLMPSDITGTEVIQEDKATGERRLVFVRGPIFANVILADEINRTPPKTQAALLEAMQERHVTAGGSRHDLPTPFFVLATQNPIEQEGTYPLPEAQLDRFMLQVRIRYPSADEEFEIVRQSAHREEVGVERVLGPDEIARAQAVVRSVPTPDHVIRYALRLVRATRIGEPMDAGLERPALIRDYVGWGAGPRASEYLVTVARARAVLDGSFHVPPEHVRRIARPVLRHRILTNFNAEADRVTTDSIIDGLIEAVPVEGSDAGERRRLDEAMR